MTLEASQSAREAMQTGSRLYGQNDFEGARSAFETALAAQPDLSPARFNLAVICRTLEQNEIAETLFKEVIASGEIVAESYNNLGILAVRRDELSVAEGFFREAIRHQFQFPLAHFNLATLLLRLGKLQEGWDEYEWRWQTPSFHPIDCPQPQWDGAYLDATLLLHTEQGIGDTFQFARFIPMIRERCRRLIFLRPPSLHCMFPVERWADEIRSPGEISLAAFQAVLPLMSAPRVLGIRWEDLPSGENYLTPERREIELGPPHVPAAKMKVGIAWAGSPTHVNDAFRSISLERFRPLLEIPQVAFYSLQIGPRASELERLDPPLTTLRDLRTLQHDIADTAAIVRKLDLVITVDTSVLHLAAGLAVPVWGLLSVRSDWRWLGPEHQQSRWYPTLRLFRQARLNDWDQVIQRVAGSLKTELEATPGP